MTNPYFVNNSNEDSFQWKTTSKYEKWNISATWKFEKTQRKDDNLINIAVQTAGDMNTEYTMLFSSTQAHFARP
jgi:hypothetical protein